MPFTTPVETKERDVSTDTFFKNIQSSEHWNKIKVNVSSRKFTPVIARSLCAPGTQLLLPQLLLPYPLLVGAPWVEWPLCQHLPAVAPSGATVLSGRILILLPVCLSRNGSASVFPCPLE